MPVHRINYLTLFQQDRHISIKVMNELHCLTVWNTAGFKPVWNETLTFEIEVPELALARFVVYDSDRYVDDFIGYYVVPVNSIVQGKMCSLIKYNIYIRISCFCGYSSF